MPPLTRPNTPRAARALGAALASCLLLGAAPARGNDFPTQARVEYVLGCMDSRGGQSYNTLYGCVCLIDHLAEQYSYDDFVKTQTLSYLYSTPGERGGVFRDGVEAARQRVKTFREANLAGARACFPARIEG